MIGASIGLSLDLALKSGAGAVTGNFGCLVIYADGTTFSDIVQPGSTNITIAEGVTYNKGEQIVGLTTGFTVSAGTVGAVAY